MPKSTVSAARKKVAKAKSAKARVNLKVKSAKKKVRSKVRSSAKPLKASTSDTQESLRQEVPQAVSAAIPLGQSIDLEQEAIRNAADGANIFDPAIGYGLALPGETGVSAVERIKKSKGRKPQSLSQSEQDFEGRINDAVIHLGSGQIQNVANRKDPVSAPDGSNDDFFLRSDGTPFFMQQKSDPIEVPTGNATDIPRQSKSRKSKVKKKK